MSARQQARAGVEAKVETALVATWDARHAFVLDPEWEDINNFINGRALVRHDGRMGVIDESGRFVIPLERDIRLWSLGEEEIGFTRGDEHGYFDRDGRVLQTFTVDADFFGSFVDGHSVARKGVKDGYIDRLGKWVIEPRFYKAEPFRGSLAVVKQPVSTDLAEVGYINRAGDVDIPAARRWYPYSSIRLHRECLVSCPVFKQRGHRIPCIQVRVGVPKTRARKRPESSHRKCSPYMKRDAD